MLILFAVPTKLTLRLICGLLPGLLLTPVGQAVSPLTTDDADTVEPGRLQLNVGCQFSRTGSTESYTLPVNPVLGLNARGELGATFGYQWRGGSSDANGIADLTLATKWRLWQTADDGFKLSGRFDLKVPAASEQDGLGTGNLDAGVVLIATRCWGSTCLDWNAGYASIDLAGGVFRDDQWFLAQAVRHELEQALDAYRRNVRCSSAERRGRVRQHSFQRRRAIHRARKPSCSRPWSVPPPAAIALI